MYISHFKGAFILFQTMLALSCVLAGVFSYVQGSGFYVRRNRQVFCEEIKPPVKKIKSSAKKQVLCERIKSLRRGQVLCERDKSSAKKSSLLNNSSLL